MMYILLIYIYITIFTNKKGKHHRDQSTLKMENTVPAFRSQRGPGVSPFHGESWNIPLFQWDDWGVPLPF